MRQQWNFSPPNSIREVEEYHVELSNVTVLELVIVPDISRGSRLAQEFARVLTRRDPVLLQYVTESCV
jgi:hypothetical protein